MKTQVAIIGDFNPRNRSHIATNDAIEHCSRALNQPVEYRWIGTEEVRYGAGTGWRASAHFGLRRPVLTGAWRAR